LRTLFGEHVVGTRVVNQALVFEMQNAADGPVQQFAVVGHDQHGMRVFRQVCLEPKRAFKVKIVGRLVEQQQVGF
jgi:hypothetical protein